MADLNCSDVQRSARRWVRGDAPRRIGVHEPQRGRGHKACEAGSAPRHSQSGELHFSLVALECLRVEPIGRSESS